MSISVLTIVKNRVGHLAQLVEGLKRSTVPPDEFIIVDMASDPLVAQPDLPFPVLVLRLDGDGLPLAAARNTAARAANGEYLLFLDVDCIPMRDLIDAMGDHLARNDALICAEALYLGPDDARGTWDEEGLRLSAVPHPVRRFPAEGLRAETHAGLFWSLVFGIRHARFTALGGFDEAFSGYGAEDTDFGFRSHRAGVPLLFMGGAGAFHQHHAVYDPPLQHVEDIVRNAQLFYDRWRIWPMEGWLAAFAEAGFVAWSANRISLLGRPDKADLERAWRASAI